MKQTNVKTPQIETKRKTHIQVTDITTLNIHTRLSVLSVKLRLFVFFSKRIQFSKKSAKYRMWWKTGENEREKGSEGLGDWLNCFPPQVPKSLNHKKWGWNTGKGKYELYIRKFGRSCLDTRKPDLKRWNTTTVSLAWNPLTAPAYDQHTIE